VYIYINLSIYLPIYLSIYYLNHDTRLDTWKNFFLDSINIAKARGPSSARRAGGAALTLQPLVFGIGGSFGCGGRSGSGGRIWPKAFGTPVVETVGDPTSPAIIEPCLDPSSVAVLLTDDPGTGTSPRAPAMASSTYRP
jgi:hypothetical protein